MKTARNLCFLLTIVLFFATLLGWRLALNRYPGAQLADLLVLTRGDIGYFPLISRFFAQTDMMVKGAASDGIHFPFLALLPTALLYKAFGATGFVLNEALFTALRFVLLSLTLGQFVQTPLLGILFAFLFESSFVWRLASRLAPYTFNLVSADLFAPLHYVRNPRPLLIFPYFLLFFWSFGQLSAPRVKRSTWIIWGLSLAVLLNSNLHAFLVAGLASALLLASRALRDQAFLPGNLRRLALAAAAAIAGGLPFFVQNFLHRNLEMDQRLGVVPQTVGFVGVQPLALCLIFVLGVLLALNAALPKSSSPAPGRALRELIDARGLPVCFLGLLASVMAMPLLPMLLGRTVQDGNYFSIQDELSVITVLVLAVLLVDRTFCELPRLFSRRYRGISFGQWLVGVGSIAGILSTARATVVNIPHPGWHPRYDFAEYRALGPQYADSFLELMRFLEKQEPYEVVLTFDYATEAALVVFQKKYAYCPEPFATTLSDFQIEERLLRALRLVGVTPPELEGILNSDEFASYLNVFYLGEAKYQLSRKYAFAPLSDYPPRIVGQLSGLAYGPWSRLYVPNSKLHELQARLAGLAANAWREYPLDLIVLLNNQLEKARDPSGQGFAMVFQNAVFRVYRRKS